MARPLATVAVGLLLFAAGCGEQEHHPLTDAQKTSLVKARERAKDPKAYVAYADALESSIGTCLARAGFPSFTLPHYLSAAAMMKAGEPLDPARYGLGISLPQPVPVLDDPNLKTIPATRRQEYKTAFIGCLSLAQKALGPPPNVIKVDADLTEESDEAQRRTDRDPAVVAAVGTWRSCMAGKGFAFATPDALRQSIQARFQPLRTEGVPGPSLISLRKYETRAALADRDCDHGLTELRSATYERIVRELEYS